MDKADEQKGQVEQIKKMKQLGSNACMHTRTYTHKPTHRRALLLQKADGQAGEAILKRLYLPSALCLQMTWETQWCHEGLLLLPLQAYTAWRGQNQGQFRRGEERRTGAPPVAVQTQRGPPALQ